ncbi:MAG: hypothetical protein EZS28_002143 [Streblomastix strix]|uniref:Protein kinase domain-containing protein n=1 Tax=Streblomastix strix TaxID=222440 RepID=A0A5J4X533_9EUKA|nr:MAG: hypothetical protein EZS28_002143 [Streblomastix strix]
MSKFEDYDVIRQFQGGSMSSTFLVKLRKTGVEYVMKRVKYFEEQDKKRADEEVEQMKKLDSRFIVKLICCIYQRWVIKQFDASILSSRIYVASPRNYGPPNVFIQQ